MLQRKVTVTGFPLTWWMARKIQKRLQAIHQVNGNPVTVTFRWSIVHSTDPLLKKKIGPSQIYRLALKKLREE